VLAPAHDGGTNAILLPRDVPFTPRMGPGSLALHVEEAQREGVPAHLYRSQGLASDLDTPEDLHWLRERLPTLETEIQQWSASLEDVGARHASPLRWP